MLKLHCLNGYIQNIYLAEYADKLLLLDGCCRADINVIEDFIINQLNRPMSDLALIVVTHMHPDHAGAANVLRKNMLVKSQLQMYLGNGIQGLMVN